MKKTRSITDVCISKAYYIEYSLDLKREVKTNFNNNTHTNLLYWWQIFWRNLYWCTHWNTNTIPKASLLKWKLINFPFNLLSSLDCKNIFNSFFFQLSVGYCQTKEDTDGRSKGKKFTMMISDTWLMSSIPYSIFSVPLSWKSNRASE